LIGFVSGLITPWIKWRIENKRNQQKYRIEMIKQWRDGIENIKDFKMGLPCGDMLWYSSLRLHMNEKVIKQIEAPRTYIVPSEGRMGSPVKQRLADEVSRIEKEWGLI
jgi:hypothetical protein